MTEQQSCSLNHGDLLIIPPYILLHMLEFLCCRHVNPMRAQAALGDLQVLVHYDQGVLVPVQLRDISWEILGICQQMTGNHQAALYSYHQSLAQFPLHKIQSATRQRIQDLHWTTMHHQHLKIDEILKPYVLGTCNSFGISNQV